MADGSSNGEDVEDEDVNLGAGKTAIPPHGRCVIPALSAPA